MAAGASRARGSRGQAGARGLAAVDAAPYSPSATGPTAGRKGPGAAPCKAAVAFSPATKNPHPAAQSALGTGYPARGLGASREHRASSAPSAPCLSFPICNDSIAGGGNKSRLFCREEAPYAIEDNVNTKRGGEAIGPSVTQREEGVFRLGRAAAGFPLSPSSPAAAASGRSLCPAEAGYAGARRPPAPPWSSPS